MPKTYPHPSLENYEVLRARLNALMPSLALEAAELVTIRLRLLERKGRYKFADLVPWAQRGVSDGLALDESRFASVKLDAATLRSAAARVARRQKGAVDGSR